MRLKLYAFVFVVGMLASSSSCNRKNDYYASVDVVREWKFNLTSANENAVISGTQTVAAFHMVVLADNSIRYDIKIDSAADRIRSAYIHLGDPVSEGALLIELPVRVYSTYASGVLTGLRPGLIDTLRNDNIEKYINVTSDKVPAGLVRGQLNSNLVLSKTIPLAGGSVVPAVNTAAIGTAFIRLASNNNLYTRIVINNDPADPATAATINQGPAGSNGPVLLELATSSTGFGVAKKTAISSAVYSTLLNNSTYVSVTSAARTGGLLRGQIR